MYIILSLISCLTENDSCPSKCIHCVSFYKPVGHFVKLIDGNARF